MTSTPNLASRLKCWLDVLPPDTIDQFAAAISDLSSDQMDASISAELRTLALEKQTTPTGAQPQTTKTERSPLKLVVIANSPQEGQKTLDRWHEGLYGDIEVELQIAARDTEQLKVKHGDPVQRL